MKEKTPPGYAVLNHSDNKYSLKLGLKRFFGQRAFVVQCEGDFSQGREAPKTR